MEKKRKNPEVDYYGKISAKKRYIREKLKDS